VQEPLLVDESQLALKQTRQYWVHRLEATNLLPVAMRKYIGSRSTRAKRVREVKPGDGVILATTLLVPRGRKGLPPGRRIGFVGAGQVAEALEMAEALVGYDKHPRKLRLESLRWFAEPLWLEQAAELGLGLLAGKSKLSDAMDFEYRQVGEEDFRRLVDSRTLVDELPPMLRVEPRRKLSFSDAQLLEIFRLTRDVLRVTMRGRPAVEIKLFLRAVTGLLEGAGFSVDYESVYKEYRRLAHRSGFRHEPSREPELQVELVDGKGRPHRFAYISLR
jgi:hypothetical protein